MSCKATGYFPCVAYLYSVCLNLDDWEVFKTWISAKEGRILVTIANCKAEMGHNNVSVSNGALSGYFMNVNGNGEGKLYINKCLHHFVICSFKDTSIMADMLKMDPMFLSSYSLLICLGMQVQSLWVFVA